MMRWLLTYSDMITLLLAFFVVLYSMAKIDQSKYEILAAELRMVFKGSPSVLDAGAAPVEHNQSEASSIEDLARILKHYILIEHLEARVELEQRHDRVILRLPDTLLFETAEAKLTSPAKVTLSGIGDILTKVGNAIAVEGFTDDVPIHNDLYPSNRHLSAARAATVLEYLIVHNGVSAVNSVAQGFGDQHPLVPNDTAAHRAQNRRVELVIYDRPTLEP